MQEFARQWNPSRKFYSILEIDQYFMSVHSKHDIRQKRKKINWQPARLVLQVLVLSAPYKQMERILPFPSYKRTLPFPSYKRTLPFTSYKRILPFPSYKRTLPFPSYKRTLPFPLCNRTLPFPSYKRTLPFLSYKRTLLFTLYKKSLLFTLCTIPHAENGIRETTSCSADSPERTSSG